MERAFNPAARVTQQVRDLGLPLHMPGSSCLLYRFRNAQRDLLYVGVTVAPANRWNAHSRLAGWWPHVAFVSWEVMPHKRAAEDAERHAIAVEQPRHNVRSAPIPHPVAESPRTCSRNDPQAVPRSLPAGREGKGRGREERVPKHAFHLTLRRARPGMHAGYAEVGGGSCP